MGFVEPGKEWDLVMSCNVMWQGIWTEFKLEAGRVIAKVKAMVLVSHLGNFVWRRELSRV